MQPRKINPHPPLFVLSYEVTSSPSHTLPHPVEYLDVEHETEDTEDDDETEILRLLIVRKHLEDEKQRNDERKGLMVMFGG